MKRSISSFLNRFGYDIVRKNRSTFAFAPHMKRLDIDVVLDVGANVGQYALQLRSSGYSGKIVSFEPVSSAFEELARKSKMDPHWAVINCAIGNDAGERLINVGEHTEMSSFRRISDDHVRKNPWSKVRATEQARVARLDDIFNEYVYQRDRVLLKMDVQGYENEVLSGASAVLDKIVAIQMEMSIVPIYSEQPDMVAQIQRMRERGFQLVDIFNGYRDQNFSLIEIDGFFVRNYQDQTSR